MRFPMRCDQYELRPEPAAPGQVARRDRDHPAQPLPRRRARTRARATGRPTRRGASSAAGTGSSPRAARTPTRRDEEYLQAKVTGIPFAAGDFIEFREPNAAGYGDPLERDPELVREDVLDDFTTLELARDAYGVVFARRARRSRSTPRRPSGGGPSCGRPASGGSLTEYFAARGRCRSAADPVSVAGNREFGSSDDDGAPSARPQGLRAGRRRSCASCRRGRARSPASGCRTSRCSRASSASAGRRCARRCACSPRRT